MKQPIIQFEDFTFQYNAQSEPTLHNINLTIYEGEKVLIAGPSGSGKSTIGHCINGLIPFSYHGQITGSLRVGGVPTTDQSIFQLSKTVGTVLQDPDGQFIGLTVAEDIAFALENDCMEQSLIKEKVKQVAQLVDIDSHLDLAPHELSGGQKQRVSLAGVMVDDVRVLLFDEPLANLDPATGKHAIELIDRIHETTQTTVVIIEHRLEDVLWRDVDRIILMDDGRIVADMSPDELLSTDLLLRCGIREPLYITALRYAGCEITPQMHPRGMETLTLPESCKKAVRDWFYRTPAAPLPVDGEEQLKASNIIFSYDNSRKVLSNISFTLHKGELVSIVGRNGAGKSTLSKLICGFERPQSGSILMDGTDLAGESIKEIAGKIGYVMQNPNQMISKNMIFDEVALGLINCGVTGDELTERVEDALKTCGLYPFREWPISALSFGQKKRVTIASILVLRPQIIILDEPTAGQDFRHYTDIMEFLLELNRTGVTIVMITHDMHLMLEYTPRAIVFSRGHKIADDTAANILTDPQIIEAASLKETSLYTLAKLCGLSDPRGFVQRFIDYDREVRKA
ncbi:MAG: ABC transporter ATP-binding protein [Angelakisella sp.]